MLQSMRMSIALVVYVKSAIVPDLVTKGNIVSMYERPMKPIWKVSCSIE